jgi:hypothetical protein
VDHAADPEPGSRPISWMTSLLAPPVLGKDQVVSREARANQGEPAACRNNREEVLPLAERIAWYMKRPDPT